MGRVIVAVIVIATVASVVAANLWRQQRSASQWLTLAPGLDYRAVKLLNDPHRFGVPAHVFRVDLRVAQLRVLFRSERSTAEEFARDTGARVVINGGFFDKLGKPLGLVIADGQETSRWLQRDWGVFMIRNRKAGIVHARDYRAAPEVTQALEVGPRLVVAGKTQKLKDQTAKRSAIGIQRDGRVIIVATDGGLSLKDLARCFASSERNAGLGCVDALHLDSGSSSQLYVQPHLLPLQLKGLAPVPTAIGVFLERNGRRQ